MIKFVIWGLGRNGRILYEILGKDKIVAYIDCNKMYEGTFYHDIPVISLEEYKGAYSNYPIIITPIEWEDEIVAQLKDKEINHYFLYSKEIRVLRSYFLQIDQFKLIQKIGNINVSNLYGITLLGIFFYDLLQKEGYKGQFIVDETESEDGKEILNTFHIPYITMHQYSNHVGEKIWLTKEVDVTSELYQMVDFTNCEKLYELNLNRHLYSDTDLEQFRNINKGKRCFIVATGPSLRMEDLDTLRKNKELSISVNGIFKAFPYTTWRPDYYILSDPSGMLQWKKDIVAMDVKDKFIADVAYFMDSNYSNIHKWHIEVEWGNELRPKFTDDFSKISYCGDTITYDGALQLAVYMGFQEIYLLGTDCCQNKGTKQHFIEDYQSAAFKDAQIHVEKQLLAYESARDYAKKHGIKIYNATRGGNLEVFERVSFDKLFKNLKME